MMTDVLLALLVIEIPIVAFMLRRAMRYAFAYHFAGLAGQLETGNVIVQVAPLKPQTQDADELDDDD